MRSLVGWVPGLAATAAVVLLPSWATADRAAKNGPPQATVEMFSAVEEGQIEVKVIPKDSTEVRLLVKNKTDQPLRIQLPAAFAAVPVLAQLDAGLGDGLNSGSGGGGGGQALGGGLGGGMMGGGMGGGGMGGGFFNVPPERVGQMKLTTVCLEHGKPEPRPAMKYEIKPIEQYTNKAELQELCRMLGRGMLPQRVAQVAAWHLANGMSWEELAGKQIRFANGMRRPYFAPQELRAGIQAVAVATRLAQERQSTGKHDSLSQD